MSTLMHRFLLVISVAGVLLLAGCGSNNNVNVGFNSGDAKNASNAAINTAQNTGPKLQQAGAGAVNGFNATPTPTPSR
jgi:uncharacterized lipoprotein